MLTVPARVWLPFLGDLWRAWQRGRSARMPHAIPWEELLPLPIEEVRRGLGMVPLEDAHPKGVWRVGANGSWERAPAAA
ncbi:MAG: hypothetical protein FJ144_02340 [Deltaproteobacteria bacterium]|nr:hypothetical protein [Deltaproteobacteria bacterium]